MTDKNKESKEPSAPLWALSYGDMVTNVLCFFVMLFALASLTQGSTETTKSASSQTRARATAKALEQAFKVEFSTVQTQGGELTVLKDGKGIAFVPQPRKMEQIPRLAKKVKERLQDASLKDKLEAVEDDQNIKIRIPSKVLFQSGSAELKPGSEEILMALSPILSEIPYDIRVDGHSDDRPARSTIFPSNWELSAARACAVVRYYVEKLGLDPARFSAQGFSSYRPQVENITEADRETNRRVEIIILTSKRKQPETFIWK